MDKGVEIKHGPQAKDGDYVLILHKYGYDGKNAQTFLGRVHDGKVYTGITWVGGARLKNPLHKLSAECVVPESYLSEEQKERIEQDIRGEL